MDNITTPIQSNISGNTSSITGDQASSQINAAANAEAKNVYDTVRDEHTANKLKAPSVNVQGVLNYAIWIISILLIAFLSVGVIYPQYQNYQFLKEQIPAKQAELSKISAFVDYLNNLAALQDKLNSNKELASQAIPIEEETPYFLDQVIQIAGEAEVELDGLVFGGFYTDPTLISNTTDSPVISKNFNVKATFIGNYSQSQRFLELLENARRLASVKSVNLIILTDEKRSEELKNKTNDENPVLYTSEVLIEGYTMKDPVVSDLSIETMVNQPRVEDVLEQLEKMKKYEVNTENLDVGRFNPFDEVNNDSNTSDSSAQVQGTSDVDFEDDGFGQAE